MLAYTELNKHSDDFTIYIKDQTIEGLFTNARVDRRTLPPGIYAYDLREGDTGEICAIENNVTVNHAGTFVCSTPIDFGSKGYLTLGEDEEADYSF